MDTTRACGILAALGLAVMLSAAVAPRTSTGEEVSPGFFFEEGLRNGAFTVDRRNGVELALRARLQFGPLCESRNRFGGNGAGEYFFDPGDRGACWGEEKTPEWNFEWSVNADVDGSHGRVLSDLTYRLALDADPGPGTDFLVFDPINREWADHAFGSATTRSADGWQAAARRSPESYAHLIASRSVAQNSWNYEFFDEEPPLADRFDPSIPGFYDISLSAFSPEGPIASVVIRVIVGDPGHTAAAE